MNENLAEIDAIAGNPEPPTFDNTIAAQEHAGRAASRVFALYNVWSGTMSDPDFQAVERKMAPKIAACVAKTRRPPPRWRRLKKR